MTAPAANTPATEPVDSVEPTVDSHEVGLMFVHEYYTFLHKEPSRLHCFYNKQSTMSHGIQGEEIQVCHGQQEIHSKILDLDFEDCKVLVSNVDSQSSLQGGIVIQVLGEMSNKGGVARKFVQTFFLAVQPRGYYVLNDVFRYLKEDAEVDADAQFEAEFEAADETTLVDEGVVVEAAKLATTEEVVAERVVVEEPKVEVPEVVEEKKAVVEDKKVEKKAEKKHEKKTDKKKDDNKEAKKDSKKEEKSKAAESKKQNGSIETVSSVESAETPAVVAATEVAAAPALAPAPAPVQPPKPKTWANLAANNSTQWGSHVNPTKGSSVTVNPPTPAKPQTPAAHAPAKTAQRSNIDPLSVYVKNITERMSLEQLKEAFNKFGAVKNIELVSRKTCAYVDFDSAEAVQAALKQNVVQVGSENVLAEERRRSNVYQNGNRPFFGNQNGGPAKQAANGHQGSQGVNRGRPNPRGGFQDRKSIQKPEKAAPTVAVK
ncbi:Ras GTPase-activating protein-binding protein 1 [Entomortierella parvispora]|uniref:Ras GTPase-activating protein-binding protein 1 n=1 Tax=Entomortierella parvispora TaxID=205924 RepID=A0A9P3M0A1_9FUNG|nr:Ras GTPase-activating protein-binding protein 1 [Entomortierella parvispora]